MKPILASSFLRHDVLRNILLTSFVHFGSIKMCNLVQYGNTALMRAAKAGRLQLVKLLIDAGASLDVQNEVSFARATVMPHLYLCKAHFCVASGVFHVLCFVHVI